MPSRCLLRGINPIRSTIINTRCCHATPNRQQQNQQQNQQHERQLQPRQQQQRQQPQGQQPRQQQQQQRQQLQQQQQRQQRQQDQQGLFCDRQLLSIHQRHPHRIDDVIRLALLAQSSRPQFNDVRYRQQRNASTSTNDVTSSSNDVTSVMSTRVPEFEDVPGVRTHEDLVRYSLTHPDEFWGKIARSRVRWLKDFDEVQDHCMTGGADRLKLNWFLNGQLNIADNCIDRHVERAPDRVALIWEKDEPGSQEYVTYKQLQEETNRLSNVLKSRGVQRGDRVVIYLPQSPAAIYSMLACARIGAIHSMVFPGFSSNALALRIQDAGAETVITADQTVRAGKITALKTKVDEAVARCPTVKRVFVAQRTGAAVPMSSIDIPLNDAMSRESPICASEPMNSEDLFFLLYTSGSTGQPKGVAHSQAGYLVHVAFTFQIVFDYKEGDIFGCFGDIPWITGHSYVVYGPLANGATTVIFESTPTYPDPGRYWETVERLGITQLYISPTALRHLLRFEDRYVTKYNRSSLKLLGSVGEPLTTEAWNWYFNVVGNKRCPIVDTWWQTETGGILISPRPSEINAEILPAMPMRPLFGIEIALLDDQGKELTDEDAYGALCVKRPWPAMARTVFRNHEMFYETYFKKYPGYYLSGDGAHRIKGKYYRITGRMDDVINISGHRLGTAEIEDILDEHPMVAESAVVGYPHDIKGEGLYAYVTLKMFGRETEEKEEREIVQELKELVRENITSYAVPDFIQLVPVGLPKTGTGKIMRRILRKIAAGQPDELGDLSTLSDASVVPAIIRDHAELVKKQDKTKI